MSAVSLSRVEGSGPGSVGGFPGAFALDRGRRTGVLVALLVGEALPAQKFLLSLTPVAVSLAGRIECWDLLVSEVGGETHHCAVWFGSLGKLGGWGAVIGSSPPCGPTIIGALLRRPTQRPASPRAGLVPFTLDAINSAFVQEAHAWKLKYLFFSFGRLQRGLWC